MARARLPGRHGSARSAAANRPAMRGQGPTDRPRRLDDSVQQTSACAGRGRMRRRARLLRAQPSATSAAPRLKLALARAPPLHHWVEGQYRLSKAGPKLVRERDHEAGPRVERKHAQRSRNDCRPDQEFACHLRRLAGCCRDCGQSAPREPAGSPAQQKRPAQSPGTRRCRSCHFGHTSSRPARRP